MARIKWTGKAAKDLRKMLVQQAVAEKFGISQASVSEFEKSARPRKDNLIRPAALYRCTPEQLTPG